MFQCLKIRKIPKKSLPKQVWLIFCIKQAAITLAKKEGMVRTKIAIKQENLIRRFEINSVHTWSQYVLNN